MKPEYVYPLPSLSTPLQLNTSKGFSFFDKISNVKGTKYITYRPAKIYQGKKWFVEYYFRDPETQKFERFKVYENLNRIKDPKEKLEFANQLKDAVNYHLEHGFDPFQEEMKIAVRNWTLVQGLNYFKQNLGNRGLRARSIKLYGSVLKALYKYLAPVLNEDIKKITKHHIQSAFRRGQNEKKWTNSTFNNYITFTRVIFNFLISEEVLTENPCKVKHLPENFKRHKYFSDEVFNKIKEKAEPELLRFMMFLYHTGTRPNEAVQLKYENIVRDRKLLFVPASISKNRKDGQVPIGDYILENYKGTGLIFNVPDRHFTRMFSKLKNKLKLDKDSTLYATKHTAAITMAKNKVPMFSMMQFFRHSNLATTESYLRGLGLDLSWVASDALASK